MNKVIEIETLNEIKMLVDNLSDSLFVLDFGATWCNPCNKIKPFFQKMSNQYSNCLFLSIDVDDADNNLIQKFNISNIPCFIFMYKDKVLDRFLGTNENKLKDLIIKYKNFVEQNNNQNNEKLNDEKLNDEKLNDEKLNDEKLNDEKLNDEKLNDEKLNDEKLNDEKLNDEKLNDEKLNDEKLNDEKLNDEKLNDKLNYDLDINNMTMSRIKNLNINKNINELERGLELKLKRSNYNLLDRELELNKFNIDYKLKMENQLKKKIIIH